MNQTKIFGRYLMLSLIVCIVLYFPSCITHEYSQNAEFHFINNTDHYITYGNNLGKFNLNPQEKRIFTEVQDSPRRVDETTYLTPFKIAAFDVSIKFDAVKCLVVSPSGNFGPLNIKNYSAEKVAKRTYKFTYTFTEADYNRAVTCP